MGCLSRVVLIGVGVGAAWWAYARYREQLPAPVRRAAGVVGVAAESLARSGARSAVRSADQLSNKVRDQLGDPARDQQRDHQRDSADVGARGAQSDRPAARSDRAGEPGGAASSAVTRSPLMWASVNAAATSDAVTSLTSARGPAYVNVGAGDLASLLAVPLKSQLPRSASNVQIALDRDQLLVRGVVEVGELAGDGTVGKLLGIAMAGRDTLQFGGTVAPLRAGFAQYRIESLRVKGFDVPERVIPLIMRSLRRSNTDSTLADNAIAVRLPRAVADLRINNGRMTLYKAVSSGAR